MSFLQQLASGLSARPGGLQPDEEEKLNRVLLASDLQAPSARAVQFPPKNDDANTRQILGHVQQVYNAGAQGVPLDDVLAEVKNRMGRLPGYNSPTSPAPPARLPTWSSPQRQAIQNTVAKYGAPTYNSPASSPPNPTDEMATKGALAFPTHSSMRAQPSIEMPRFKAQAAPIEMPGYGRTPPSPETQTTQVPPKPQELPVYRTPEEQAKDASYTPPSERMDAVLKAGGITPSTTTNAPDPLAARDNTPARSNDELIAHVQRSYDELSALERSPVENKNSRWKGALKSFIRLLPGAMAAAASHADPRHPWGSLLGGLIAAAGGGVYGAVDKTFDERMDRRAEVEKRTRKLQRELIVAKSVADVEKTLAEAGSKGQPKTQTQAQMMSELRSRLKFTNGKLMPNDARSIELAQGLGITVQPKPPGQGRGYVLSPGQVVGFSDGAGGIQIQFPHDEEGSPAPSMTDAQRAQIDNESRRLALDLARYNESLARDRKPPVTFDDWLAAGQPSAPGAPSQPAQQQPGPASGTGPRTLPAPATSPTTEPTQAAPTPAPSGPASGIRPRSPRLVPTGEKPADVPRRGEYGRRRGGSRRASSGGEGEAKYAVSTVRDINSLVDQIQRATNEGQDEATVNGLKESLAAAHESARRAYGKLITVNPATGRASFSSPTGSSTPARPKLKPPFDLLVPSH